MILRLIDIVLIVLFGFISIATIENQRELKLAESESVRNPDISPTSNITISVDVWGDIYHQEELEPWSLNHTREFLAGAKNNPSYADSVHVRIRADEGAPMGPVKQLIQAADNYGLSRSLIIVYQGR